ncbi:MAG: hypothetical protein K6A82_03375 [Prevotella sp.]|nr:hypothetical protein [Prevotella sp.]
MKQTEGAALTCCALRLFSAHCHRRQRGRRLRPARSPQGGERITERQEAAAAPWGAAVLPAMPADGHLRRALPQNTSREVMEYFTCNTPVLHVKYRTAHAVLTGGCRQVTCPT